MNSKIRIRVQYKLKSLSQNKTTSIALLYGSKLYIDDSKDKKSAGKDDRRVEQEFFHATLGIIPAHISSKGAPETGAPILEENRESEKDRDYCLSDEENTHKGEETILFITLVS